jgi:hypothetical protein
VGRLVLSKLGIFSKEMATMGFWNLLVEMGVGVPSKFKLVRTTSLMLRFLGSIAQRSS